MICDKLLTCVRAELSSGDASITCNRRGECIVSSDARSEVRCEEKGKQYILENDTKEQIINYLIDGGVIRKQYTGTTKCDGLFVLKTNDSTFDVILIELKGTEVKRAFEQLSSVLVLEDFSDLYKACSHIYARIVMAAACPNLKADPRYVKLAKIIRRYGGNIKIHKKRFKEKRTNLSSNI